MKIGTNTIRRSSSGTAPTRSSYVGANSTTRARNGRAFDSVAYPLYQPGGKWHEWDGDEVEGITLVAPVFTPVLAGTIFNVLDYGADPSGETDSTDAIQRAITDCGESGGGTVYLPRGLYTIIAKTMPDSPTRATCFRLYWSNVTIEGDGPELTILSHYAPGGIRGDELIMIRGFTFTTLNTPRVVDNLTMRGFRCTGNSPQNSNAGEYSGENGSLQGWDTSHKFIGTFTNYTQDNFIFEYLELDNYRGEIIYSGGSGLNGGTIRKCLIRGCNASATSMGGEVILEDSYIYDVLQGAENLCMDGESFICRRNVIIPNKNQPPDQLIGASAMVYLGFRAASLLVEDNVFGYCYTGAVFCSEFASNVTIQNNTFNDSTGVYGINLNQYAPPPDGVGGVPVDELNKWENWVIQGNTFNAITRNIATAIYTIVTNHDGVLIDGNTTTHNGEFEVLALVEIGGVISPWTVSNNVIAGGVPIRGNSGERATYTNNALSGDLVKGSTFGNYDDSQVPLNLGVAWPKANIHVIGPTTTRPFEVAPWFLPALPGAYTLEINRDGPSDVYRGGEIKPDPTWNSLTRGYMLYRGSQLVLQKNVSTGVMDFVSHTPRTNDPEVAATYSHEGPELRISGKTTQAVVKTTPTAVFNSFAGVPFLAPITLDYDADITFTHTPGVMEMWNGVDFVTTTSGSISAIRALDGTLLLGTHAATEDTPLIGAIQTGDPTDNVYQVAVTICQDGAHPSAVDGYYAIERKEGAGAFAEIEQIVKGDFTGVRKTYVYTDTTTERDTSYTYRVRAVSPGTPDVVSRWSNSYEVTLSNYTGALTVLTEVYKTASAQDLEIDIYRPNDALATHTAVICVHGGGWVAGTRENHAAHCVHFAAEGFTAFNISYRLDDGTDDMEDSLRDVRAAIRWVRENAATYNVDPDDIVILGESAGGHLAGCAAFIDTFDDAGGNQGVSSRPNRAVLVNPITYLPGISWYEASAARVGTTPVPDDTTQLTPADTGVDLSLRLSPQLYSNITTNVPDVLFIHGDSDTVVPFAQSEDMHDLLVLAGNTSTLETMVGSDHSFFLPGTGSPAEIAATLVLIDAFLAL